MKSACYYVCLSVDTNRVRLVGDDADTSQRRTVYDKVIHRPLSGKDGALCSRVLIVIRKGSVCELPAIESVRRTLEPS